MKTPMRRGFTLIELLVVVVMIAILAGITMAAYSHWREDTAKTTMKHDLLSLASAMNNVRNFSNGYPSTIPSNYSPSSGNVVQLVGATPSRYCANIYSTTMAALMMSYDSSSQAIHDYLCGGVVSGDPSGGTVPKAPRNTDLISDFSGWTFTGTAAVNSAGELVFGSNGTATTPPIRVDAPRVIYTGGDMYAAQPSPRDASNGYYHLGITYLGSDGSTAVQNSAGATSNGCARAFPLKTWNAGLKTCSFSGGPNVQYVKLVYYSTASGYSSPDLKIRKPLVQVTD